MPADFSLGQHLNATDITLSAALFYDGKGLSESTVLNNGGTYMLTAGIQYREKWLGHSKLDFLVGDTYLEVKTPLQNLMVDYPAHVKRKKVTPFHSTERFVKHINELADSLETHQRAILLSCFIYSCPSYKIPLNASNTAYVKEEVQRCIRKGIEIWQVNFNISPEGVVLQGYTNTTANFLEGGSALWGR
ncbi:DNA/RNA nuclease SfsA [Paenibacillus stellifer]|uniref:DNA/RNA nuclease SfsA n=1 Tax=Paenibacillus stellifer TaxID=169760 RepID=UPI000A0402E1